MADDTKGIPDQVPPNPSRMPDEVFGGFVDRMVAAYTLAEMKVIWGDLERLPRYIETPVLLRTIARLYVRRNAEGLLIDLRQRVEDSAVLEIRMMDPFGALPFPSERPGQS